MKYKTGSMISLFQTQETVSTYYDKYRDVRRLRYSVDR